MTPIATPKRSRGRPRLGPPMQGTGLYLPVALAARLRAADPSGAGKLSAGLRALVGDRDALAAALTRACADLLSVDRAAGDDTTPAQLAADYVAIARTEAADRAGAPASAAGEN